jgi:uncharacterized protein (TIGR02246 family)
MDAAQATADITALIKATVAAWDAGDGAAYAAGFTEDATYVTFVGTLYRGRDEIGRAHQALFDKFLKGSRLVEEVLDVRFLGPDTAVVTSRGDVAKHGDRLAKLAKVQTYTFVREADGRWRIAAFHNTKRKELMEKISFAFAPETAPTR